MEAWRIPRNRSTLVGVDLPPRRPFGKRFGLALLTVGLVAASCSHKQTTVASDTTTTTIEPISTTIATDKGDIGVAVEDDEPQPEPSEPAELIDGVYCDGRPNAAVERAEFENRLSWETARPELVAEQITLEATAADLGEWRMWPDQEFAILVEPVDELLQIYVSTSNSGGIASCVMASALAPLATTRLSCAVTPDVVGVTVLVSGVPQGIPIRYTIDGEFAVEMESSSFGGDGIAEQIMWRSVFTTLGESADAIAQFDDRGAQYSSVFSVPWVEPGQTATASIDVTLGGEALSIDCGESSTMSDTDFELACSVTLIDGLPHIEVQSTNGLHAQVFRNGVAVLIQPGNIVDLDAERGVPLIYTATAIRFSHGDLTAECGTVEVSGELPLASLLQAAQPLTAVGFGPHVYWRVAPVCENCPTDPVTLYFFTEDEPNDPWGLPVSHPGLVHPGRVHQMLLDAIASGADVQATIDERGNVVSYTIDGQGVSSDCLTVDTLPPELVSTVPASGVDNYCGYIHQAG